MQSRSYTNMVCVHCLTFNHEQYIEDALKGFVMQKTDFPFIVVVIDDCSTDKTAEIIGRYEKSYPDIIKAIYLKENYFSQGKSKQPLLDPFDKESKYIALCEGDDYWIATDKLQCQVDYLDNHPDYTMVCNRAKIYSEYQKKFVGEHYCYDQSQTADPKDIIRRTGLFIPTCSITYRREISDNKPDYWLQCKVGDYPLQIMCAMKGKVYYFDNIMSVYRRGNPSAWTGQQRFGTCSRQRLEVIMSQVIMFEGFGKDFPEYNKIFQDKIFDHINRNIPSRQFLSKKELDFYLDFFSDIIKKYSFRGKIDLLIRKSRIPGLRFLYKPFTEKYSRRFLKYKY